MALNNPTHIIIHCSDSPRGRGDTAADVHSWHLDRGFDGIGYHYVIGDDGDIEVGRPPYWTGAHCPPYNNRSLGVCIIGLGESDFSEDQLNALTSLIRGLMAQYDIPADKVLGHGEADPDSNKTCPNMDMNKLRSKLVQ